MSPEPVYLSLLHLVGILYTVLAGALFILSIIRHRHSQHDFADEYRDIQQDAIKTAGQEGTRIFGRPYVTAGWVVIGVTVIVLAVEIALIVLIVNLGE